MPTKPRLLRSPGEAACLGLLVAVAAAPLAALLAHALAHGGEITGATGMFPADQAQYMAWIRDAAAHLLASNRFDLAPSAHVFLHPLFALSGGLIRLGASVQIAYLVWCPVSIATLFVGYRAFVHRFIVDRWHRTVALLLALFASSPVVALMSWLGHPHAARRIELKSLIADLTPAMQLWGYFPIALVLGLLPLALLLLERAVDTSRDRGWWGLAGGASAAAVLIAWVHPWQGLTLIGILIVAGLWGRSSRTWIRTLPVFVAAAAPLLYYELLSHLDTAWKLARAENAGSVTSLRTGAVAIAPLVALGLAGYFRRPRDFGERILVAWPIAVVVLFVGQLPYATHLLESISLPLSVLGIRALGPARPARRLLAIAAALLIVPGWIFAAQMFRRTYREFPDAYVLRGGEARAVRFIDRAHGPGGVLAPLAISESVPAMTGRPAWVGHSAWSPAYVFRAGEVQSLFAGKLPPRAERRRVLRIRARWVLVACDSSRRLVKDLEPVAIAVHRFGCAAAAEVNLRLPRPRPILRTATR